MRGSKKNETERLMRAVAAFSAEPETVTSLGRALVWDGESFLQAVLAEIGETVLRRHLVFESPTGLRLTLDVSERRIATIPDRPFGVSPVYETLVGRPLCEEDAPILLALLADLAKEHCALHVFSKLPPSTHAADGLGISVLRLKELAAAATGGRGSSQGILEAFESGKRYARAIVWLQDGRAIATWGDADRCKELALALQSIPKNQKSQNGVTLWGRDDLENGAILLARCNAATVAALCAGNVQATCFATWCQLFVQDV